MKNVGMVTAMELVKYLVAAGAVALLWLVSLMAVWARGYEAGVMDDPRKVRATEWISVEDRLPKIGEPVLMYADGQFEVSGYWGGGDWGIYISQGKPTHWMPLPDVPRREGQNGYYQFQSKPCKTFAKVRRRKRERVRTLRLSK